MIVDHLHRRLPTSAVSVPDHPTSVTVGYLRLP